MNFVGCRVPYRNLGMTDWKKRLESLDEAAAEPATTEWDGAHQKLARPLPPIRAGPVAKSACASAGQAPAAALESASCPA